MPFKIVKISLKDLSGRLARWSLSLQGFDFTIEHQMGSLNVVPDALSSVYAEQIDCQQPVERLYLSF